MSNLSKRIQNAVNKVEKKRKRKKKSKKIDLGQHTVKELKKIKSDHMKILKDIDDKIKLDPFIRELKDKIKEEMKKYLTIKRMSNAYIKECNVCLKKHE